VAVAHTNEASAIVWLDRVADAVPGESLIERVALAKAWDLAGTAFSSIACWKKSNEVLRSLIERPDIGAEGWNLFAQSALQLAEYDDAERGWRKTLAMGEKSPELSNNLAYVLLVRGRKDDLAEARKLAESAVAAAPANSSHHD